MINPFPGVTIKISSENQASDYLNTNQNLITIKNNARPVTNYEYEVKLNDEKRTILILKPQYVATVIGDLKNIMKYSESSQYVDENTIKAYNPKITGV